MLSAYWNSATLTPAVSTMIAHAEAIGTRRGSRPAIAAHGVNHPAYWREKTGEHASTAQSTTSDGTPRRSSPRDLNAFHQTAATRTTSTTAGTHVTPCDEPTRTAPCSHLGSPPPNTQTSTPTVLSISQPVADRKDSTCRTPPMPPRSSQPMPPTTLARTNARDRRRVLGEEGGSQRERPELGEHGERGHDASDAGSPLPHEREPPHGKRDREVPESEIPQDEQRNSEPEVRDRDTAAPTGPHPGEGEQIQEKAHDHEPGAGYAGVGAADQPDDAELDGGILDGVVPVGSAGCHRQR